MQQRSLQRHRPESRTTLAWALGEGEGRSGLAIMVSLTASEKKTALPTLLPGGTAHGSRMGNAVEMDIAVPLWPVLVFSCLRVCACSAMSVWPLCGGHSSGVVFASSACCLARGCQSVPGWGAPLILAPLVARVCEGTAKAETRTNTKKTNTCEGRWLAAGRWCEQQGRYWRTCR